MSESPASEELTAAQVSKRDLRPGAAHGRGRVGQRQRQLAAPAFAGQRLAKYGAVIVRHTERMLDGLRPREVWNIHADMMALTLGIATKTLFSSEVERDVAEIGQAVEAVVAEIAARYARPFVIPDLVPLPGHIRRRAAFSIPC